MATKPNPYKPTEALYAQQPGEQELCRIERYIDGSVMVTGLGKKPRIYESAGNALKKAIKAVQKRGFAQIPDPYAK